jgi:uroporphyrinogen-III decarboxylase
MKADNRFEWYAGVAQSALLSQTGANQRDFFLDKEVCRYVNDMGRKRVAEIFGDRIRMPGPMCAAISYGHMACLGAKIEFPDNSEPNVEPMFSNVAEGVKWLKREERFEENKLFKHYYDTYLYLKESFPDEEVFFYGFGHQGAITTAVGLRGTDFYMDILDEPELAKEYLDLLTTSTVRFCHLRNRINGQPAVNPVEGFVTDDLSSLVSPRLWPEFVVPYWNKYYEGLTTGKRGIHVENLVPDHLKYLEDVGIKYYDPSVSAKLSPAIIRDRVDIDFTWRLLEIYIPNMTVGDVVQWIHRNVAEGARHLHTYITGGYCLPENQDKARVFMDECEKLEKEFSG